MHNLCTTGLFCTHYFYIPLSSFACTLLQINTCAHLKHFVYWMNTKLIPTQISIIFIAIYFHFCHCYSTYSFTWKSPALPAAWVRYSFVISYSTCKTYLGEPCTGSCLGEVCQGHQRHISVAPSQAVHGPLSWQHAPVASAGVLCQLQVHV
jgi:hypothetical protein